MLVKINGIRAVGFDLDGTLIDTLPDLVGAVNEMLGVLGGRALTDAQVRGLIGDGADQLVLRAVAASFDAPVAGAAEGSEAQGLFYRFYAKHLFESSRLYPDTLETLRSLTQAGFLLCCVTNKASRFAVPLLQRAGLQDFFAFTLCADVPADRKPSPNLLLEACRRLGVVPSQMLYVGDSHTDVIAAHAAGCAVVAVTFGYHKSGLLEQAAPAAMVSSLREINDYLGPVAEAAAVRPHREEVAG